MRLESPDPAPTAAAPVTTPGRWRRLVAAQAVSQCGTVAQQVALGYLGLAAAGPLGVGLVVAARYLPALAAPHLGAWLDRVDRRRALRAALVAQTALTAAFAVAVHTGHAPLVLVCAFAVAYAPAATLESVATTALVVDRAHGCAPRALARVSLGNNLARVGGALVAAVLLARWSPAAPLALNAVSLVVLAAVLAPDRATTTAPHRPPAGACPRWWRRDELWPTTVGFVVFAAAGFQPAVLVPVLGAELLGGAPGVARLTVLVSLGTIAGALAAGRWPTTGWRPPAAGYLVAAAGLGALAASGGSTPATVTGALAFGAGASWALAKVAGTVAASLEASLRARALGWYRLVVDGTTPLGGLVVAALCAWTSPALATALCALCTLGAAALSAFTARHRAPAPGRRHG